MAVGLGKAHVQCKWPEAREARATGGTLIPHQQPQRSLHPIVKR